MVQSNNSSMKWRKQKNRILLSLPCTIILYLIPILNLLWVQISKNAVRVHFKIQNKQMCHILMTSTLLNVLKIKIPWQNFIADIAMSNLSINTKPIVIVIITNVNRKIQRLYLIHLDVRRKLLVRSVLIAVFISSSL